MTIKKPTGQLRTVLERYAEKFSIELTPDWFVLKLSEEQGELVQSYLRYTGQARETGKTEGELKEALGREIADVIALALLTAEINGIDVESSLTQKWLTYVQGNERTT